MAWALLPLLALLAVAGADKCVDKLVSEDARTSMGLPVSMEWRSASGDSCEDYEKLMYCDGTSDMGIDWSLFGAGKTTQSFGLPLST
jgi:hypothetical protein